MEGCFEHEERVSQVTLWATPSPSLRLDLGCFNHHQTCKAEGESGVTDISSVESFTWQLLDFAVGLSSTDSRPVDDYTTLQVPLFRTLVQYSIARPCFPNSDLVIVALQAVSQGCRGASSTFNG